MRNINIVLDDDLFKEVSSRASFEGIFVEDLIRDWVEDRMIEIRMVFVDEQKKVNI